MFGMYGISAGVKLDAKPPSQVDLTGKTVVVVGGTSGTGRALAKKALEKGAQVTVVGRSCQVRGSYRTNGKKRCGQSRYTN